MIDFGSWIDEEYRVPDENSSINSNLGYDLPDEEDADFKNVNL